MNGKTAKLLRRVAAKRGRVRLIHMPGGDLSARMPWVDSLKSQWKGTPRNKRGALRRRLTSEVS